MTSRGAFRKLVWRHYRAHGRHELVWRHATDPYKILISEIMLQQTQVSRVGKFYKNFIKKFPNFRALANARVGELLEAWQGLGYNRRALLLQKAAQRILKNHKGKLPDNRGALEDLPGIGQGTSGSLLAFAFNKPAAFIETNIRRVFIYHFFQNREKVNDAEIEPLVLKMVDQKRPREWYWALMDYGAMLGEKSRGRMLSNPNLQSKHYARQSAFKGSDREIRGKLLKLFLKEKKIGSRSLSRRLGESPGRLQRILRQLIKEGFIAWRSRYLELQ